MNNKIDDMLYDFSIALSKIQGSAFVDSNTLLINVRNVIEIENKIKNTPGVFELLVKHINTPVNPADPNMYNYAYPAGLILARGDYDNSAELLLDIIKNGDPWCQTQARNNLIWLSNSKTNLKSLMLEYENQKEKAKPEIPLWLLINSIVQFRNGETIPLLKDYFEKSENDTATARTFITSCSVYPEFFIELSRSLYKETSGIKKIAALGIMAVYLSDGNLYHELLTMEPEPENEISQRLWWLGRLPCIDSLDILISSFSMDLSRETLMDMISSISLFGYKKGYKSLFDLLFHSHPDVVNQATSALYNLLGDNAVYEFSLEWHHDEIGCLDTDSKNNLIAISTQKLESLGDSMRYFEGTELLLEDQLDYLYRSYMLDHTWFQWVAITRCMYPFMINKNILANYPILDKIEELYQNNKFSSDCICYNPKT